MDSLVLRPRYATAKGSKAAQNIVPSMRSTVVAWVRNPEENELGGMKEPSVSPIHDAKRGVRLRPAFKVIKHFII